MAVWAAAELVEDVAALRLLCDAHLSAERNAEVRNEWLQAGVDRQTQPSR
jgi:hypothetical protein